MINGVMAAGGDMSTVQNIQVDLPNYYTSIRNRTLSNLFFHIGCMNTFYS